MTPERWKKIKQILVDALALPDASWSSYLDTACGDDPTLRAEVESFLTVSSDQLREFLSEPIVGRPSIPETAFDAAAPPDAEEMREVRIVDLAPYTRLRVTTKSSEYWLTIVAPFDSDLLVRGGRRFPEETQAQLLGDGTVAVGREIRLKVHDRLVTTSRVRSIEVVPDTRPEDVS